MRRSPRPNRMPAGGAAGGNSSVSDWLACAGLDTSQPTRIGTQSQVILHYQLLDLSFASMSRGLLCYECGGYSDVDKTTRSNAALAMRVGPSEPPRRRRFQTAASCAGTMAGVVNVAEKALQESVRCEPGRRTRVNR